VLYGFTDLDLISVHVDLKGDLIERFTERDSLLADDRTADNVEYAFITHD
jgi:hypothetical protein